MITVPGDYCPCCGTELDRATVEDRERRYCPTCERVVWLNSKPVVGVVVHDGRELLLGKRAVDPHSGSWGIPGGNLEHDEHPRAGAVRETEEETGVALDADALDLYRVDHAVRDGSAVVAVRYEARREAVAGDPAPGREMHAARFDTLDGFASDGDVSPFDRELVESVLGD